MLISSINLIVKYLLLDGMQLYVFVHKYIFSNTYKGLFIFTIFASELH